MISIESLWLCTERVLYHIHSVIYFHVRGEHCLNDKIIFVIVIRFSQEPTWDTNSAFFARAAGRNPMPPPSTSTATVKNSAPSTISQSSQNTKNISTQQPAAEQIDPVVLRSRQVAGWLSTTLKQNFKVMSQRLRKNLYDCECVR